MSIQIATYEKTATALKDYAIDWSAYLEPGEKIASVSYNVAPVGLTVGVGAYADTIDTDGKGCVVWLGGGVVGTSYTVTCHVTTDNVPPRIDDRDIIINVTAPAAILPPGILGEAGSIYTNTGLAWEQRRFAIIPDVDLTGNSANAATNVARINAAQLERPGSWTYLPDGVIAVSDGITVQRGCSITGRERGMDFGQRQFGVVPNVGTLINAYGTGKLFTLHEQSRVTDLSIYYPDQVTTGTPTPHDWTFYAASGNHGISIERIVAPNAYQLIYVAVNGATIDSIIGAPISQGIALGRCADVVRVTRCQLNAGGVFFAADPTYSAWIKANGCAYSVDGAEAFYFAGCFAYGYKSGLMFYDLDADGDISDGGWFGGGFDVCERAIWVRSGLSTHGLRLFGPGMPTTGGFNAIDFDDTAVPGGIRERPAIHAQGLSWWGNMSSCVMFQATSYGIMTLNGGTARGYTSSAFRNESTNAFWRSSNVISANATRLGGAGVANMSDLNGLIIP